MDERARLKRHARALEQLVFEVVNSVDPMGLLHDGEPADEYAPEVHRIVAGLLRTGPDESELVPMIKGVFDRLFWPGAVPERLCAEIARGIRARWTEAVPTEGDSGEVDRG